MGVLEFYRRPVATATGLLIVLVLCAAVLSRARLGPSSDAGGAAFTVIIEHFGVDAPEIERVITRPLEDTLGSLPGLKSIRSVSDYGSARVTVFLRPGAAGRDTYLLLRDSVDRLYSQLPGSVQRPRIVSSAAEGRAFFIASARFSTARSAAARPMNVTDLATLLEKELKPSLEKIDGADEVEIGGGSPKEIHVVVDDQRVSRAGLDAASIARAIQSSEMLAPLGVVRARGLDLAVVLQGRLGSLDALRAVRIPLQTRDAATGTTRASWVTLGSIATVDYAPRERDEIEPGGRLRERGGGRQKLGWRQPC